MININQISPDIPVMIVAKYSFKVQNVIAIIRSDNDVGMLVLYGGLCLWNNIGTNEKHIKT
ncbi:MAG: hypothetical protein PWQ25_477 [Deferribacteres bacterium]|jgi:hypothetical protein|nr:hypothetical protein [Deferribacteres bacterium]